MRVLIIPVPLEDKICVVNLDNPDPQTRLLMVVSLHNVFRTLTEGQREAIIDGMLRSLLRKKHDTMSRQKIVQVGDNQVTVIEDRGLEPGEWVVYCNPDQMDDLNLEFIYPHDSEPGQAGP